MINRSQKFSLQDTLDQIHGKIILSELIGREVSLKRDGYAFKGLCPFHQEKTPSFRVEDTKGFYHCFGCGAHGDAISFIENRLNYPFIEAVEYLAHQYGIPFQRDNGQISEEKQIEKKKKLILSDILGKAAHVFHETLLTCETAKEARNYLQQRRISQQSIQTFQLGFCDGYTSKRLQELGVSLEVLNESGLTFGSDHQDRFKHRIVFPVHNLQNQVIAFGGRVFLPSMSSPAKYLNSSESVLFQKRKTLFNLNRACFCAKDQPLIVVEGYVDVISMAQHGFPQTVSSLGTALTEDHIQMLWRYSPHPILCFDGDQAGIKASIRAAFRSLPILKTGKTLFFCYLPDGKDPDDILKQSGHDGMANYLGQAKPLSEVVWNHLLSSYMMEGQTSMIPEDQAALKNDIRKVLNSISDEDIRKSYSSSLYDRYFSFLKAMKNKGIFVKQQRPRVVTFEKTEIKGKILLGILLTLPILLTDVDECLLQIDFKDPLLNEIKAWLLDMYFLQKDFDEEALKQQRLSFLSQLNVEVLLDTHAKFLKQEGIPQEEMVKRWKEVYAHLETNKFLNSFRCSFEKVDQKDC